MKSLMQRIREHETALWQFIYGGLQVSIVAVPLLLVVWFIKR